MEQIYNKHLLPDLPYKLNFYVDFKDGDTAVISVIKHESKQYTLVVAPSGSGKSDFVDHINYNNK